MSYSDFQQYCANYGFINTPITNEEYWTLIGNGFTLDDIYSIACDVNVGFSMELAIKLIEGDRT